MRQEIKAKEPIKIYLQPLKGGRYSLYLREYVPGKNANHCYRKERLEGLCLEPETNASNRRKNRETMRLAEAIKVARINELNEKNYGVRTAAQKKASGMTVAAWMRKYEDKHTATGQSKSTAVTIHNVAMHLANYKGNDVLVTEIDKAYMEGFVTYLAKANTIGCDTVRKPGMHRPKPMAKTTARLYYNTFVAALNEAVRAGVLQANPAYRLGRDEKKAISEQGEGRTFLTADELRRMADTPCLNDEVKRAFLFACFCGLRVSDITTLQVGDILPDGHGGSMVHKRQVKTRAIVDVPLSEAAMRYLPDTTGRKADELLFTLPNVFTINYDVKAWAKAAGIEKRVTFHVARHTFATLMLTVGGDLFTTSKLLGHQDIRTTQIYAEIVDQKKREQTALLNNIL